MENPSFVGPTRESYDRVAVDYELLFRDELAGNPMDRAVLAVFAELVAAAGAGPVVDVGCGPGRITGYLDSLGCDVSGIDLSPGMVAVARQIHPGVEFTEGSMLSLDLPDASLSGLAAWYSVIHIPPGLQPTVFSEFRRVLAPGGQLVLAFQVGDERVHLDQAYGHPVSIDAYRLAPDRIADLLTDAGLVVHTRIRREPTGRERTPQAYLLAGRPSAT
jgi:SAM-dependent methyltransferase